MQSNIKIKFLSEKEFSDAKSIDWRYEHVDEDNLGFADKLKNRIFVRKGLDSELTKYLINHEISHLFEMEGTDEDEHGIRHKKFWKEFLAPLIAPIFAPLITGQEDPWAKSFNNMAAAGGGFLTGGPFGALSGAGSNAMQQAQNPNEKSAITFGRLLNSGMSGANTGTDPFGNSLQNQITGATGGYKGQGIDQGQPQGVGNYLSTFANLLGSGGGNSGGSDFGSIDMGGGTIGDNIRIGNNNNNSGGSGGGGSGLNSLMSLFSGALGQGQSAQGGSRPGSSSSSFRMPDMSQQQNANPQYSGWTDTIGLPPMPSFFGMTGAENIEGLGGQAGLSKMPMNPGLGQAGLELSGQDVGQGFGQTQTGQQGGFDQMFGQVDPMGFNYSNGGQLDF